MREDEVDTAAQPSHPTTLRQHSMRAPRVRGAGHRDLSNRTSPLTGPLLVQDALPRVTEPREVSPGAPRKKKIRSGTVSLQRLSVLCRVHTTVTGCFVGNYRFVGTFVFLERICHWYTSVAPSAFRSNGFGAF